MANHHEEKGFLLTAAMLFFVIIAVTTYTQSEEDAFIYYRYAVNWAHGEGFVFNAGEFVEGYSSPVWMMILALIAKLQLNLPLTGPILGIVCGVLTIMATHFLAVKVELSRFGKAAAILSLAVCYPFIMWSRSGLETPFYSFILVTFAVFYISTQYSTPPPQKISIRHQLLGGMGIALVGLSRPEGILLVVVIAIDRFLDDRDYAGFLRYFLTAVLCYSVFLFWRYCIYGSFMPNTSVKIHPERLVFSVGQTLNYFVYLGVLPLVIPLVKLVRKNRQNSAGDKRLTFLILIVLIVSVCYTLASGGDYKPFFRFLVPSVPITMVAFWGSYEALGFEGRWRFKRIPQTIFRGFILICLLFSSAKSIVSQYVRPNLFQATRREWLNPFENTNNYHVIAARWIVDQIPPNSVVAYGQMGKAPYYAMRQGLDIHFIDTLGLTDKEIGRLYRLDNRIRMFAQQLISGEHFSVGQARENAREAVGEQASQYILKCNPDIIIMESILLKKNIRFFQILLANAEFRSNYDLLAMVPSEATPNFLVYARKNEI